MDRLEYNQTPVERNEFRAPGQRSEGGPKSLAFNIYSGDDGLFYSSIVSKSGYDLFSAFVFGLPTNRPGPLGICACVL